MAYRREIAEQIESSNKNSHVFVFDALLEVLQNVTPDDRRRFYIKSQSHLNWLYGRLADRFSRETLIQIIKGALTSSCDCYEEIASKPQYFPSFILDKMNDKEVFVDAGAYIGDTIMEFIDIVEDKYKLIYGFEPDKSNFLVCEKNCCDKRIQLFRYGIGKEKNTLFFSNEFSGAQVDEGAHFVKGDTTDALEAIEVVRLDDIISDEVTYIKMDIEGMELDALKGAERLLREYKPKLAISIYHKMEDIIEIPEFLDSLNLGYKMYIRHYWEHNGTDTVLFAVL